MLGTLRVKTPSMQVIWPENVVSGEMLSSPKRFSHKLSEAKAVVRSKIDESHC